MTSQTLENYGLDIANIGVKCKVLEHEGSLKAIVGLDFGPFNVKGFRISKSKYTGDSDIKSADGTNLWIVPPSYKDGGGKFHPTFFMPDKAMWEELKKHIISEYENTCTKMLEKRFAE
ncbi:MAG: hypothetical protein A2538_01300 [Candidatus Magasanikbacteria bacterium RIFOXYD2_FULL_41_14]|uniref:Uncharacterized protein n=1 Tax=Candidatus Magasanikbacteria bacterium RIFOXYD2_FULL_41_14 TaxID=1798709 RepID=A0A1F6PBW1_9BACT|nr:MAG: hypothetical protein A2538_01300 [Candidatus Magasanikbacteria bacterium RIFOXYD2_FULL_41_14]